MTAELKIAMACGLGCGLLAVGSSEAATRIEGRVVGHDGKPVSPSHVQVVRTTSGDEVAVTEVGEDGSFEMRVDAEGIVFIRFAALWHQPAELPLRLNGEEASFDIRLATYEYDDAPPALAVRGDMNSWRFDRAPRLQRDFGTTYQAVFKSTTDTLRYQIMGAVPGRAIPGTDAIGHEYDGEGDYRSLVLALHDQVVITWDPDLVIRGDGEQRVRVNDAHEVSLELVDITDAMEERKDSYHSILAAARRAHEDPAPRVAALREELPDVVEKLERESDPILAPARLLEAVQLDRMTRETGADSALALRAIESLEPESPYWSLAPEVIGYVIKHTGGFVAHREWLDRMIEGHPDPDVRKNALVRAVTYTEELELDELKDAYFEVLKTEYPASTELEYVNQRVLVARVEPGMPVPNFRVTALDDPDVTYSNASLRGKTVLLDFWATWCKPCLAEMDSLHKVYEEFRGEGLEILSLSFDRAPIAIPKFRETRWPMPWLHTFVEGAFESPIASTFGVTSIPKPVLMSPDGEVLATGRDLRGERLRTTIETALRSK